MPVAHLAWKRKKSVNALTHIYALLEHCLDIDCEFSFGRPIAKHHIFNKSQCLKNFLFYLSELGIFVQSRKKVK
jgi:hypothetical protein